MDRGLVDLEPGVDVDVVPVAVDGVPHQDLPPPLLVDEGEAMAAPEDPAAPVVLFVEIHVESLWRDAVGGLQCWLEVEVVEALEEVAEERGRVPVAVVEAEAAGEGPVGDDAAPAGADEAGGGGSPRAGRRRPGPAARAPATTGGRRRSSRLVRLDSGTTEIGRAHV